MQPVRPCRIPAPGSEAASFFHGERITYVVLAVVVGLVAGFGALTLTDSRAVEEVH